MISEQHRAKLQARARMRVRKPNVPAGGVLVAALDLDGEAWCLYTRPQYTSDTFYCCKLVSVNPRPCKANFHFGVERSTGRLTNTADAWCLKRTLPDVYAWVARTAREALCGVCTV